MLRGHAPASHQTDQLYCPPLLLRLLTQILLCIFVLSLNGCLIPIGSKVSSGHRHSDEALAFLDQPGTTRAEVIANLGPPLIESHETRTLVYVWHEKPRYLDLTPKPDSEQESGVHLPVFYGFPEEFALFVAYDERGVVQAHEIRFVDDHALEDECRDWYRQRTKRQ